MHRRISFRMSALAAAVAFASLQLIPAMVAGAGAADSIAAGTDAFAANDFKKACDAFNEACKAEPKNNTAARDLGIAYIRLEEPAKATHPLEQAMNAKAPDRGLVLARAYERIAAKSPMQATKAILTYFDAHPTPMDEPMINALGTALASAEAAGIKSQLVTDAGKAFKKLNTKLEATRSGEKHWGPDWMSGTDADAKQAAVTNSLANIRVGTGTVRTLTAQIADVQRKKDSVLYTEGDNNKTAEKDTYQKQIDALNVRVDEAQKVVEESQKTLDANKPKWPENIPVDSITLADKVD